jgi:RNA polymerase primary sigma factor
MSMRQLKISKSITNRESPSLDKYLQEIGRVEMIAPEEEAKLAVRIKLNDQKALDKLIKANLRFVVSVAKQYQNQGLTLPDLINEGNLGLIKAAQKFDETKGFKFISYAVWWIRQSILQGLADQSRIVRVPVNRIGLGTKISKAISQLEQEFEREPTPEELSENLHLELDEVTETLQYNIKHVSISGPIGENDDSGSLLDVIINPNAEETDRNLFKESLKKDVEYVLNVLTIRQKEVLKCFFGIGLDMPLSLDDIGHRFQLTRERVRQIKDMAIEKIRSTTKCGRLKYYLG